MISAVGHVENEVPPEFVLIRYGYGDRETGVVVNSDPKPRYTVDIGLTVVSGLGNGVNVSGDGDVGAAVVPVDSTVSVEVQVLEAEVMVTVE